MERITKGDVETAAKGLNAAAKALGLDRTFIVWFGSGVQGTAHEVAEIHPDLSHPTSTKIGRTYAEAERYLRGMAHALQSAKRDRDYQRENLTDPRLQSLEGRDASGYPRGMLAPVNSVGTFDPDARAVVRSSQDVSGPEWDRPVTME